jgi:DNA-binding transcriptional LysR family regulator
VIAASRDYVKRKGPPKSPQDLVDHDCIAVGNLNSWVLNGPKRKVEVPVSGIQRYRSSAGLVHAVVAGIGLAPLPTLYFDDPVF